jgi:hypothetical protein
MHKTLFCFSLLCTTLDAGALNDSPQHFQKLSSEMNNLNSLQNNLYFARVIEDTDAVQPKLIQPSPSAKNKPEQVEAEKKCTVEAEEKCTKETSCCLAIVKMTKRLALLKKSTLTSVVFLPSKVADRLNGLAWVQSPLIIYVLHRI